MADALTFDFDAVTPRMLVDFKEHTDCELMALVGEGLDISTLPAKATAGLIWLAMRMSGQPDATFDDALDTPFTALEFAEEPEADPTPAS